MGQIVQRLRRVQFRRVPFYAACYTIRKDLLTLYIQLLDVPFENPSLPPPFIQETPPRIIFAMGVLDSSVTKPKRKLFQVAA